MAVTKQTPVTGRGTAGGSVPADLRAAVERGKADAEAGRTVDAAEALREFRELASRLKAEADGKAGA